MVRLPLQSLLLGCWLKAVHSELLKTCGENQYPIDSRCCDLCPPGAKLVDECTQFSATKCSPCGEDEFLKDWNSERRCHQHRYCDPNLGFRVHIRGTLQTDTTCVCDKGLHCSGDACDFCATHSSCPPGSGVKQMATAVSDTLCEPCPAGSFSGVDSTFEECRPWTSCESEGLVEKQPGTNTTDTLCGFRHRMRALLVIPVVIAILFIVLLVFACSKKFPKVADNKAFHLEVKMKEPVETIDPVDFPDTAPVQETLLGCQPVTQEDGKESRISVQERQ